jgi:hypothetical protein
MYIHTYIHTYICTYSPKLLRSVSAAGLEIEDAGVDPTKSYK